jgi:hypothetical protein
VTEKEYALPNVPVDGLLTVTLIAFVGRLVSNRVAKMAVVINTLKETLLKITLFNLAILYSFICAILTYVVI